MPTQKMVALLALLYLTGCADGGETWSRGTAQACDSCTSDLDCAAGLLCDQDSFACKSVEQLKAKKLNSGYPQCDADCWIQCPAGHCYMLSVGATTRCGPKTASDCSQSVMCKEKKTYCTFVPGGASSPAVCQ